MSLQDQTAVVLGSADAAIQRGHIVREGVGGILRAQADVVGNLAGLLGVVLAGPPSRGGLPVTVAGVAPVLLEVGLSPLRGDLIYVSATVAGRGTTVAPANARIVGVVVDVMRYTVDGTVAAVVLGASAAVSPSGGGGGPCDFGTGALGAVVVAANDLNFGGVREYTQLTIDAGVIVSPPTGDILVIRATESIVVNGLVDLSGKTQIGGGTNFAPNPTFGSQARSTGGGGGAGAVGNGGNSASVGTAPLGANYTQGTNGAVANGGTIPGGIPQPGNPGNLGTPGVAFPGLATLLEAGKDAATYLGAFAGMSGGNGGLGGNGGAGGQGAIGVGGVGGLGGGVVILAAPSITIGAAGAVRADGSIGAIGGTGGNGGAGTNAGGGGGGGGGSGGCGGLVLLVYETLVNNGALSAAAGPGGAGGTGGLGDGTGREGGNGATGAAGSTGLVVEAQC